MFIECLLGTILGSRISVAIKVRACPHAAFILAAVNEANKSASLGAGPGVSGEHRAGEGGEELLDERATWLESWL